MLKFLSAILIAAVIATGIIAMLEQTYGTDKVFFAAVTIVIAASMYVMYKQAFSK